MAKGEWAFVREGWDMTQRNVAKVSRLALDLLSYARESGPRREVCDLNAIVREVAEEMRHLADEQGVALVHSLDPHAPALTLDPVAMHQALLNLTANAIEHTPEGGQVTLGVSCTDDWAVLEVADTGPGIPEEEIPNIFERFYRLDPSRKRTASGGTGLGLSIAYWITRSHGGTIEVSSEVGTGTKFTIQLPLSTEEACLS